MATPSQLMQTIGDATGVALPTIVDIDRRLVTAGLRTKGGRGFNAAQMTSLDAARLLTGLLGSPQANLSVEAVERYAETRVDTDKSSEKLFAAMKIAELTALPANHSFVDALDALIASAATGSLAQLIAKSKDAWVPRIEIFAFTRATRGRIRIMGLPNKSVASVDYFPAMAGTRPGRAKKTGRDEASGDLEQSRRITERTILSVAKLLAEEGAA